MTLLCVFFSLVFLSRCAHAGRRGITGSDHTYHSRSSKHLIEADHVLVAHYLWIPAKRSRFLPIRNDDSHTQSSTGGSNAFSYVSISSVKSPRFENKDERYRYSRIQLFQLPPGCMSSASRPPHST